MSKLKTWISAFRLRTLPLALSTVMMGGFIAYDVSGYSLNVVILSIITTLLLQILSNLANDYGDGTRGTDNENRLGPERAVQSGIISPGSMKTAIIIFSLLSLFSGLALIRTSLHENFLTGLVFLLFGISAITAAIKYTVGRSAYGYSGLGDLFVFIFFGIIAVCGTYYLATLQINFLVLLPASTMGLLSTGVLNLNNMRDMDNDKLSGKHTIAMKLGYSKARKYHYLLITVSMALLPVYSLLTSQSLFSYFYIIIYPLFINDLVKISNVKNKRNLDPYLKKLAISTLLLTMLFGAGLIIF